MHLESELRRLLGYERFRPGQKPIVEALLAGRSALGILPTGGGKSVCYQLPALIQPGLTVVVSPLIALMKDQVDGLRRRGVTTALELHSHLPPGAAARGLRDVAAGKCRLLYVSPERLGQPGTIAGLRRAGVRLFVVDEAHCISHWGHDFRPDYLALADRARALGARVILALTATATPKVREEIIARLGLQSPCVIINPFDRPNLFLSARSCLQSGKVAAAARVLGPDGAGIVYVGRQKDTLEVASSLVRIGIEAVPYHGGMERDDRTRNQDAWIRGRARVVVGTVAFGMGIDKPDVRSVVHLCLPSSLEAYYQEIGRAGRDGTPARCCLLTDGRDVSLQHWFIERRHPSEYEIRSTHAAMLRGGEPDDVTPEKQISARAFLLESGIARPGSPIAPLPDILDLAALRQRRNADERRLEAILEWASTRKCRRAALLRYFGETVPSDMDCRACDNCREGGKPEHGQARELGIHTGRRDPDDPAVRAALSAAVRDLGPRGIDRRVLRSLLTGGLRSSARASLHRTPHFASLRGLRPGRLGATEQALLEEGSLDVVAGPRPRLAPAISRDIVPEVHALAILRLVESASPRLSRTKAAVRLGGDRSLWIRRLETLARAGYLSAEGQGRLVLTEKGEEAIVRADRRGAV